MHRAVYRSGSMSGMETHTPDRPLRIALISTPMLPVPPPTYAGTERVVAALGDILVERGHEVTLYAPGDSEIIGGGTGSIGVETSAIRSGPSEAWESMALIKPDRDTVRCIGQAPARCEWLAFGSPPTPAGAARSAASSRSGEDGDADHRRRNAD